MTKKSVMTLEIPVKISDKFPEVRPSVLKNMIITLQGIFKAKSVNLVEVSEELPQILNTKEVQVDSHYRRLTRFFNISDKEKEHLIPNLLKLGQSLLVAKKSHLVNCYLTLDGTKWQDGDKWIHLLCLCMVVNGVSIPLCWEDLSKKGHSSQDERIAYFETALKTYDLSGKCLLADREYIGRDFFDFLCDNKINFVIRLKKGIYVDEVNQNLYKNSNPQARQQHLRYSAMERKAKLPKYHNTGVSKQIKINGRKYLFIIKKNTNWKIGDNPNDELIYLLTTLTKKRKAIKAYGIRWSIECCFKHLKTKGFDLEQVNLKGSLKIMLIVAMVSFLYTICVVQGLLQSRKSKTSDWKIFKTDKGTKKYLAKSFFKKGKELLARRLFQFNDFVTILFEMIRPRKVPENLFVQ